ncbi:MAG TPA: hypothetical protein VNO33_19510, partial [Kofleriaceae bacterium]|nr:hypothetical protein [Kofleriaceae bacterium]
MRRRRGSLGGRLALGAFALVVAAVGLTIALVDWLESPALAGAVVLLLLLPATLYLVQRLVLPLLAMFRAMAGTVTSYRDGDFAFSLAWKR